MIALPVPAFAATPDPAQWVPVLDAAERLGKNPGHFARRCRDELAAGDLAKKFADPSRPGPDRWFVHRAFDARLAVGAPLHVGPAEQDLDGYSDRQVTLALQRRDCVERFRAALRGERRPVKEWLPRLLAGLGECYPDLRVSRVLLYRWHQRFDGDVKPLIDTRGGDRRSATDPAAWAAFESLFCHPNAPTLEQCWAEVRALAEEHGWRWCSLSRCYADKDNRVSPEKQAFHRRPKVWRNSLSPFIAQDPESFAAGECYISDHKLLDLWCRFGETIARPWVTSWLDWRTRRVTGWVLSLQPNSSTIRAALRHALLDPRNHGGPARVTIDHGKDFESYTLNGVTKRERRRKIAPADDGSKSLAIFAMLQIDAHFALPYTPTGKSRKERWFRTLTPFCKSFPTYTGESPDSRPARLGDVLDNPRLVPTFEHVRQRLADHIAGDNADADHNIPDLAEDGVKLSPDEAMARWCETRRVLADPGVLDRLMQQWHKPVTVGRNGITLTIGGTAITYGRCHAALSPFKAEKKAGRKPLFVSFDPHDVSSVRVHDGRGRLVCIAAMNDADAAGGRIGVEHVRGAQRQKASYTKALKVVGDQSIIGVLSKQERIALEAARRPATAPAPPPGMRIVATPLDGGAAELQRAELKAAVGAESPAPYAGGGLDRIARNIVPPRQQAAAADPPPQIDPFARWRERHGQ